MTGASATRRDAALTAASAAAEPMRARVQVWACLVGFGLLGFFARLVLAVLRPTIHRPDEIFQNIEPAHRLWTGWGVVTWEWRDGIRSWLFPDALYGVMRLSEVLHLPAKAAVPLVWAALSAVAAAGVVVAVAIGHRRFGLLGAILCGLLTAIWPDLVYFGPKTLSEVQAGNLLLIAAGLASIPAWRERPWIVALIGGLLALVFDVRFQLLPALVAVGLWTARLEWRRGWLPLLLGALIPLAALGIVDAMTWGSPFQSIWKNFQINLLQHKADHYGVEPIYFYLVEVARRNGAATIPIVVFFLLGARHAPLLALTACIVGVSHSLIAHKEISFIYAALPLTMITAGLGTARFVVGLPALLRQPARVSRAPLAAYSSWLAAALLTSLASDPFENTGIAAGIQSLWGDLRLAHDLCGIGLYSRTNDFPWIWSTGYTGLDRPVPMYLMRDPPELREGEPGANYILVRREEATDLQGFERGRCSWSVCLMHRTGPCVSVPSQEISEVLRRRGQ